jgi:3-methyladenine DNA glycosylase/8-oxoguanine DNA glycosylase
MIETTDSRMILRHLRKHDPVLGDIIKQVGPLRLEPRPGTIFAALLKSIVYQQLSGKAAATIHGRVVALLPRVAKEQPQALLDLSEEQLRGAGLSANKTLAVRDLARRTVDGSLPSRRRTVKMTDEEIIEALTEVRGIGRWTVEMLLIFWLGRPDVLPLDDLGIRKGFALVYGHAELPTAPQLAEHGQRWQPFRSAASWYLWRALELPKQQAPFGM